MRVSLEAAFVGVRMMFDILDRPDAMQDAQGCRDLPVQGGEVALRNVSFSYDGRHDALKNLTLVFPAGRTTALVGPSGGGKSTIMSLLLRLYDPQEGFVEMDGLDLRGVTRQSLQARTAYVGQNTFLFATSVRENIRMGRRAASDAEIEAAARAAQAHAFIIALPQGYDTQVGENGVLLSGGQRQRLSLARAIVKDAPILLLDEATSALDNRSEWLVRDAIATATRGRTTILIAHRLSTVLAADEVAFIEGGRLVEQGGLTEMLNGNGKVAALFGDAGLVRDVA
jgi:ATP-binding cassette subfamily B protein